MIRFSARVLNKSLKFIKLSKVFEPHLPLEEIHLLLIVGMNQLWRYPFIKNVFKWGRGAFLT